MSIPWDKFTVPLTTATAPAAVNALGSPLAAWWLKQDVCRKANAGCGVLNKHRATSWIVFANHKDDTHGVRKVEVAEVASGSAGGPSDFRIDPPGRYRFDCPEKIGLLRPALILPVRWTEGTRHSDRLPKSVQALADDVRNTLREHFHRLLPTDRDYCLELAIEDPNGIVKALEDEAVGVRSGWFALAAGLYSAASGIALKSNVWATGEWNIDTKKYPPGVIPVGEKTLPFKVEVARQFRVAEFFLPGTQIADAQACLPPDRSVELGELRVKELDLLNVMQELLASALEEPAPDAGMAQLKKHYSVVRNTKRGRRFYQKKMLKRIIEDVRKRLTTSSEQPAPDSLVTVLSSNWELVPLAISVLGAKRCLLLYTEEMAEQNRFQPNERTHLESVTNWCNENSVHCKIEPKEFSFDQSMPDDFEKHVNAFRQDDEPLIFDVTPGNKLMNYCFVFDERLTKQGDQFAYLKHSWHDESRGHDPGEEFMVLWPAREMWPRDALLPPASDTDEEGPHDD